MLLIQNKTHLNLQRAVNSLTLLWTLFEMQTIVLTLLFAGKIYRIEIKLDDKQSELFKKYIIRR